MFCDAKNTNVNKPEMFRCCIPGCAGAILNPANIRRAFGPHCNAFHNTSDLVFIFNFEFRKGWDLVSVPATRVGEPLPGFSTPGHPGKQRQKQPSAAILDVQLDGYKGNTGPNIRRKDKYRFSSGARRPDFVEDGKEEALKGKPGSSTDLKGEQTRGSGVFRVDTDTKGGAKVVDSWMAGVFVPGKNLRTVPREEEESVETEIVKTTNTTMVNREQQPLGDEPPALTPEEFENQILAEYRGGSAPGSLG